MSWLAVAPSPFRGWIQWVPRSWPAAPSASFDLVSRRLIWPDESAPAATPLPGELPRRPGIALLPAVDEARQAELDELRSRLLDAGCATLEQAIVGAGGLANAGRPLVIDPVDLWLTGGELSAWVERVAELTAAADVTVALPLVAGLTPPGEALAAWLAALAPRAPTAVVGITAELSPFDRRRLVESLGEASFDAVFHGRAPSEHELARLAAAAGLRVTPPRPRLAALPPRAVRNLELAGALWEAAELTLRLGLSEAESAAMFASARRLELTPLDIAALGREGNLSVFDWPAAAAAEIVGELLAGERAARLEDLRRRWREGQES